LERGAVDLDWAEVFQHAAWALVEEHRRAGGDADAGVDATAASLATTLTVAVLSRADESDENDENGASDVDGPTPDGPTPERLRVHAAAVGDSPAYVLADGSFEVLLGDAAPIDGLIGGGTRALPRDAGAIEQRACTLPSDGVLLICSDGLALPLADGTGDVGQALARELASPPDIIDFARLLDFTRATYDDDRTLVAVWPGTGESSEGRNDGSPPVRQPG
jgi:hypothetical protein